MVEAVLVGEAREEVEMVEAAMAAAAMAVAQGVEQVEVEEGAAAAAKEVVDSEMPHARRC